MQRRKCSNSTVREPGAGKSQPSKLLTRLVYQLTFSTSSEQYQIRPRKKHLLWISFLIGLLRGRPRRCRFFCRHLLRHSRFLRHSGVLRHASRCPRDGRCRHTFWTHRYVVRHLEVIVKELVEISATRAVIIVIELSLPILPQKYIRGILVEGRCLLDSTGDYVRGAGVTGIQTLTTEDVETLRPLF